MCTGRVDLSFPLRAFLNGADGVFVGGCWLGECHYLTEGNYDALGNMKLLRKLFQRIGLDPRRLRIEWIAASQGNRFAEVVDDFVAEIGRLGPLGKGEGLDAAALTRKLRSLYAMVPQLKLLVREKLQVRVKSADAYEKLYDDPKTDALIDALMADPAASAGGLPGYFIEPDKCVGCMICFKKCPVHAIEGANKTVHVIDQDKCTHCGTCFYSCPPRIGAIRQVAGESPPPPPPQDERAAGGASADKA
jgi:coenzyme F420-reducing hydrogenase delta subunit/ferredoxin